MAGRLIPIVALAGLLSGCQSPGPILGRQTTLGSLKASVSQLEFRNEQLEKQLAELKSDNRHYEERLVQEKNENDDLATRLDNAKSLLGDRGKDIRTGSRSKTTGESEPLDEPPPPRARRSKSSRPPPAAVIPGRLEPAREPSADDLGDLRSPRPSRSLARRPAEERWLPVRLGVGSGRGVVK